jgi:hypothetical protein
MHRLSESIFKSSTKRTNSARYLRSGAEAGTHMWPARERQKRKVCNSQAKYLLYNPQNYWAQRKTIKKHFLIKL